MKAVLYARVSSREQEKEGYSIPAQVKLLEEYANKKGLTIVEQFTEAETAKQSGRGEFSRLLEYLRKVKEPYAILVEKTDRLTRNFKDVVHIEELINTGDIEVHLVKENEVLSRDSKSQSKFIFGIRVLVAKNYSDNLSEEVKKGQTEKAQQGYWPSVAPYGYKNNLETHYIETDPETSLLVQRAFELYATQEFSVDTLREKLYQEGFRYRPATKRVPRSTLERILKNPIYIGDFVWNGKYYKGKHIPLVSIDQFKTVKTIMSARIKGQATKWEFQFTGVLTCFVCGRAVTAELKKGKYIYYHCANRLCSQKNKNIREESIESQILQQLESFQLSEKKLELIVAALKESQAEERQFHQQMITNLQNQINRLQTKLDSLYEDKLEGVISKEFWAQKHQDYIQEQKRLLQSLNEATNNQSSYADRGVQLLELAQKAVYLYKKRNYTERRQLLRFVSSNYVLNDEKVLPVWNTPFNHIYNFSHYGEWRGGRGSNPRHPA